MRYLLVILILVLLAILGIGIHAYTRFTTMIAPLPDLTCCPVPTDTDLAITQIRLTTADQVALACWHLVSHNRAAILVLHGEGGSRQGMLAHIAMFGRHGYGVLACDRRAHGASAGTQRSWGWLEAGDVGTMLAYVQHQPDVDPNRIGIFGFSMGAQIALRAASQYPAIHALVADGPVPATTADLFPPVTVAEWPGAAIDWLDNWFVDRFLEHTLQMPAPAGVVAGLAGRPPQPLLLIVTGQTGNGRELRQGAWFYAVAREPRQLWELHDVGHGEGLAKHPAEYTQQVVAFFDTALLKDAPKGQP